jgi:nucleoside-diphosphate-sugar epimerase
MYLWKKPAKSWCLIIKEATNMQVSILGCGFLGHMLAAGLLDKGYAVKGSTTTPDKLAGLRQEGIDPYLIDLENCVPETLTAFLQGSEVLVVNIPPKIKTATVPYPDKMRLLLPYIQAAGIAKVLFVSSTSVYADAFPYPIITEDTLPSPEAENGRQLLEAEQVLQNSTYFETTILRLSGLIGSTRHPINQLAGREGIANPDAPINLVDRITASYVIYQIIEKNAWGGVFLAADNNHTAREVYYTAKAKTLQLPLPQFSHEKPSVGKIISSAKAEKILGVSFNGII